MYRRRRIVAGLVALAAVACLASPDALLARLRWVAADPARLAVALVVLALVRPALAWPTTALAFAAGYGYGLAGLPFALALVVLTSVPPYLLARRARGDGRIAAAGERLAGVAGDRRGVIAGRLLPAPSDAVSVAAGVAGVGPRPYLLGTAVGEAPWAVAGVLAGSSADALSVEGLSTAADPRLVAAAVAAAALLCAGPAYRRLADAPGDGGETDGRSRGGDARDAGGE